MLRFLGADEAFRMASRYPAEMLGINSSYGSIAPGRVANLVICDDEIDIKAVVRSGSVLHGEMFV